MNILVNKLICPHFLSCYLLVLGFKMRIHSMKITLQNNKLAFPSRARNCLAGRRKVNLVVNNCLTLTGHYFRGVNVSFIMENLKISCMINGGLCLTISKHIPTSFKREMESRCKRHHNNLMLLDFLQACTFTRAFKLVPDLFYTLC